MHIEKISEKTIEDVFNFLNSSKKIVQSSQLTLSSEFKNLLKFFATSKSKKADDSLTYLTRNQDGAIKGVIVLKDDGEILLLALEENEVVNVGREFLTSLKQVLTNETTNMLWANVKDDEINVLNDIGFKTHSFSFEKDANGSYDNYYFQVRYYYWTRQFLLMKKIKN